MDSQRTSILKRSAIILASTALIMSMSLFVPPAHAEEPYEIPLLMIVVGFDGGDYPTAAVPYDGEYDWNAALFGREETIASYYRDMSDGLFSFAPAPETSAAGIAGNENAPDRENDGIVHITLHQLHGAWGPVNVDSAVTRDFANMVVEALHTAEPFVDYATFDTDGDGVLSERELTVCVCVAGYEASSITDYERADIPLTWSHSGLLGILDQDVRTINGVRFDSYIAISELDWGEVGPIEEADFEPLGIMYHELGHALGLPDLYAVAVTEGPWSDYTVGPLSLMDCGGWQYADDGDGWQNIPTSLDAWSRYVLGWSKPKIITKSGDYVVSSQWSNAGYAALLIPTSDPNEYFLIENRQPEGHDISLSPDYTAHGGLTVWHIDNGMYERYYDANRVNDADHRPCVMVEDLEDGTPNELLLYNDLDDSPDTREGSGIVIQFDGASAREMIVHVDLDAHAGVMNAAHTLNDAALHDLRMTPEPPMLERIATVIRISLA